MKKRTWPCVSNTLQTLSETALPWALSPVLHPLGENPRFSLPLLSFYYSPKHSISFVPWEAWHTVRNFRAPPFHRQSFRLTEYPLHSQGSSKKQCAVVAAQALGGKLSPPLQMGYEMPPALLTAPPVGSPVHLRKQRSR